QLVRDRPRQPESQILVEDDVVPDGGRELVELEKVEKHAGASGLLHQRPDEQLLPLDAAEVGRRIDVTSPHEREREVAVHVDTAGPGDLESRLLVDQRTVYVDVDPADGVHDVPEPGEVDLDVVVERDEIGRASCRE